MTSKKLTTLKILRIIPLVSLSYLLLLQQTEAQVDTTKASIKQKAEITSQGSKNPIRRPESASLAIQFDQDFFFLTSPSKNQDRNYTQGTSFTYSNPALLRKFFMFYPFKKLNDWAGQKHYGSSISLGGTAFTPLIIDSTLPIIGDRPFSFLLYFSTSSTFENSYKLPRTGKFRRIYNSYRINYGVLGTNIGYAVQGFLHRNVVKGRPVDPKGWNYQISKGGAPALLFEYNRFQRINITNDPDAEQVLFDLGWNLGGSVGYYDRVYTGLYSRFGRLKPENQARWNGGFSSTTSASYQLKNPETLKKKCTRFWEYFLYTKLNATAMFSNAMLVGQGFKKSDYTLESQWTNVGLFEWEYGFVIGLDYLAKCSTRPVTRTIALQFRQVFRSPEFNSGIYPERWHYFGSAGLIFPL